MINGGTNMTTFTLNRNMDTADFLFVALNESSCRDLRASHDMDFGKMVWGDERATVSLSEKVKKFFATFAA